MPDMPATVLNPTEDSPDPQMELVQQHINHVTARGGIAMEALDTLKRGRKLSPDLLASYGNLDDPKAPLDYGQMKMDLENLLPYAFTEKEKTSIIDGIKFLQPKVTTKAAPAQ